MKHLKQTILALAIGQLAAGGALAQSNVVKIDGSSTVYPITEAVAEEFQKAEKNAIKVTVGISGTGGGFKKFCRGEIDISNASRPILKKEMEACAAAGIKYFELPVAFDALTVVINPKNTFIKQLTVEELKKMWEPAAQGKITRWNQVNPAWPDAPHEAVRRRFRLRHLRLLHRSLVGKAKSSRGDYTASEDDNVLVQGVTQDTNALGYFGYAYYAENTAKLKAVPVVNPKGKAVLPSMDNVINGSYEPLSRPIFIYVNEKALRTRRGEEVRRVLHEARRQAVAEVKYVPLPEKAYTGNMEHLKKGKLGTVFGGTAEVGITIDELMKREAKL
jgi:phosphate transport system substrate-binding protein